MVGPECFKYVHSGERRKTGSGTSRIWLLSSAILISTPFILPISQEYRILIPDLLFLSAVCLEYMLVGQGSKHRFVLMEQSQNSLFNPVCTFVLLYCLWRKTCLGGKTAYFQASFLIGKLCLKIRKIWTVHGAGYKTTKIGVILHTVCSFLVI